MDKETDSTDSPENPEDKEMNEQPEPQISSSISGSSFESSSKKSNKKLFIILGIIILLLVGGWLLFNRLKGAPAENTAVVASSAPEPTPTPAPVLERSEWSFEILNGSGITGEAKRIADQLIALGYQVIKTGNADRSDYEVSQILVRGDSQDKIDLVIADIKDIVRIASVGGQLEDSTASARIILGKD